MTDNGCFKDETTVLSRPSWGTHACLVYRSRHDLIETLVPYFRSGLEQNACCVWITAEPLQAGAAKKALSRSVKGLDRHLKRGRIEILDACDWYLRDGGFSCSAALHSCVRKGLEAQERGYEGLFISGNVSWLTGAEWSEFMKYEAMVNRAIGNSRIAAVCAYPLDACGARELLEIASTHRLAVIRQDGVWQRIALAEEAKPPDEEMRWAIGRIEANIEQFATLADRIRHPLQDRGPRSPPLLVGGNRPSACPRSLSPCTGILYAGGVSTEIWLRRRRHEAGTFSCGLQLPGIGANDTTVQRHCCQGRRQPAYCGPLPRHRGRGGIASL